MTKRKAKRRLLPVVLAALLLVVLCGASVPMAISHASEKAEARTRAASDFAASKETVDGDSFLIGGWVSYYPFEIRSYEQQTENMAAAGLNFNIFPYLWSTGKEYPETKEAWQNIDKVYRENNMVYLLDDDPHARSFSDTAKHVQWAEGLENCIGYHVCDEPHPSTYDSVVKYYHELQRLDPTRPPFVNLLPAFAGQDYRAYVTEWVEAVGAENLQWLSHDYYPLNANNTDTGIYRAMEVMRSVAYDNGKMRTHGFPQSSWWSGKRMPNADEMRWNAYAYVAYGFKALTWFNYVSPGTDESGEGYKMSPVHRDGVIYDQELFDSFTETNWSIRGLGKALMNLDTAHAYHTRDNVTGVEILPDDYAISPLGTQDLIISEMEAKDGSETHIMVFNKSWTNSATESFAIDEYSGINGLEWLNPVTGEYEPMDVSNRNFTVSLRPGEGKLYKVVGTLGGDAADGPVIDAPSGRYYDRLAVTITPPEGADNAEIYYTLDGSYPSVNSARYTRPIVLGEGVDVNKYTLRAVTAVNGRVSDVVSREYFMICYDDYNRKLYGGGQSDFTAVSGSFEKNGGRITLASLGAGGDGEYLYTADGYECFVAETQLHISGLAPGEAGLAVRTAEGDDLRIGVSDKGVVRVTFNGEAHPTSFPAADFDKMSFDLKVIKLFDNIVVYVDDAEILSVYVTDADFGEAHVGVFASGDIAFAADSLRLLELDNERQRVIQTVTSVSVDADVKVELYTPKQQVLALLPSTVTCFATGGVTGELGVDWYSNSYDRTLPGEQTFYGTLVIPDDSLIVNDNNVRAQVKVLVRYDLVFWEIEDLVKQVESLDPSDYTERSWKNLSGVYDSVISLMTERDQPQSVIFPLKRYLEDGLNGLVNPSLKWFALDEKITECKNLVASDYTPQSYVRFAAVLGEISAMSKTGPLSQADVDGRVERLETAKSRLVKAGNAYDLSRLTEAAKKTDESRYTAASYARLQAAISAAEKAMADGGSQEEYECLAVSLGDAIRGLVSYPDTAGTSKKCGSGVGASAAAAGAVLLAAAAGMLIAKALGRRKERKKQASEVTK